MTAVRVLVVDDEPAARRRIVSLLEEDPDIAATEECIDGDAAIERLRADPFDLVFLDVQMPGKNGLDVVDALGTAMPATIFVTAYDRHAIAAFDLHAVDYLLKPFSAERFRESLARAKKRIRSDRGEAAHRELEALLRDLRTPARYLVRIPVTQNERTSFLAAAEVEWIESAGNYARLHARGATFLVRMSLGELERQLEPAQFVRIHRGALINLDAVDVIESSFGRRSTAVLRSGARVAISRRYEQAMRRGGLLPPR